MNLAVLGPGLLGGSIALAARRGGAHRLAIWARREESAAEVRALNLAEIVATDLGEVVREADLVVLCVPVGAMKALAEKVAPLLRAGAIVTDVGSVKAVVVRDLAPLFHTGRHFIGSHPMAGSEQTGLAAARADLFDEAVCIVTPQEQTPAQITARVSAFWESLGCRVCEISPEQHDAHVALVSHLPHLAAAALVATVASVDPRALAFSGPGFRDTTRVASGSPEMWAEILLSNREAVCRSGEAMIDYLRECLMLLASEQPDSRNRMTAFLQNAKDHRDRQRPARENKPS